VDAEHRSASRVVGKLPQRYRRPQRKAEAAAERRRPRKRERRLAKLEIRREIGR
jgi:hypothetical protein